MLKVLTFLGPFCSHFRLTNTGTFTGEIQLDPGIPNIDLSAIEIQVYRAEMRPSTNTTGLMEFDEYYEFSVNPDADGSFSINKPSSYFSLSINLDTLPTGIGIDRHTVFYHPNSTQDVFTLSEIDAAQISGISNKSQFEITLFNQWGEKVFAPSEFQPSPQAKSQTVVSPNASIQVNGIIDCGKDIVVSEVISLSNLTPYERINFLYENGLITQAEKITSYCDMFENGGDSGVVCYTPIIEELEDYYNSTTQISSELRSRVQNIIMPSNINTLTASNSVSNSYFTVYYDDEFTSEATAKDVLDSFTDIREIIIDCGFNTANLELLQSTYRIFLSPDSKPGESTDILASTYRRNQVGNTAASYIYIWNFGDTITDDLYETFAHEYFHAVQYTYNCGTGDNKEIRESTAGWFASAFSGHSGVTASWIDNYLDLSHESILNHSKMYGTAVFPFAVQKAYGGYSTIRKTFENLNDYDADYSYMDAFHAYDDAIASVDSSGSYGEAFEKCAAWSMYADYFFEDLISGDAQEWEYNRAKVQLNSASTTYEDAHLLLDPVSFRHFTFYTTTSSNKSVSVTLDFDIAGNTTSTARTLRVYADGSIDAIGGDCPTGRYTVVVNNFRTSGIREITVVGINAEELTNNRVSITAQII